MTARIGRNIFSLAISRIVSGVILFFVYIRAITYLGPEQFGKYSLVLAFYVIFMLLVDLGISKSVIKRISEDKRLAPSLLGNYFVVQLLLGVIVLGLFIVIPDLLQYDHDVAKSMTIVGLGIMITALSLPFSAVIQAMQRIGVIAGVNFINTLINALWLGLAIIFKKDLVFIFWLYPILGLINILLYGYYAAGHARLRFVADKAVIKSLFLMGAPFLMITGFEMLIQKIDVIIQKIFLPYTQVGLYSGAYRFVDFLTFIPAVVSISLFPVIAGHADLKNYEVRQMANHINRYLVAIGVPLGMGATLIADKIILTLFDQRFLGSVRPFQILVWSSVLTLFYAVPNVIMLVKRTNLALVILALATAFNGLANWLLIPRYGIVGSAWITVISYIFIAIAYTYFARQETDFRLFPYFIWPVVASAIMGAAIYFLRSLDIFSLTAISLVIYFGILFMVKFITRDDLQFLKTLLKKEPAP